MLPRILNGVLRYQLSRRIGSYVLLTIVAVAAVICVLLFRNYEADLMLRLERMGFAAVSAAYSGNPNASESDLLAIGRVLERREVLSGGILLHPDGTEVGRFGESPEKRPGSTSAADIVTPRTGGRWYDVTWSPDQLGVPYQLVARLDAGWIWPELIARLWTTLGMVVLIAFFSCAIAMTMFGRTVVAPMIELRDRIGKATRDPGSADRYIMEYAPRDELGDVIGATNRLLKQVGATHRDSLDVVHTMAERAAMAILTYDGDGQFYYANRACVRLLGLASVEQFAETAPPMFEFPAEAKPMTLPESLQVLPYYSREAVIEAPDGRRIDVVVNASRVPSNTQLPVRYYASITDISSLRDAQKTLERKNVELVSANRAKSEFLANMSHELRTPLNAIIGFSDGFMSGLFGPLGDVRYQDYARDINESGRHLLSIINDILDLSKVETGRMELHEAPLEIGPLIDSAVRIIRERADAAELNVITRVPESMPSLLADETAVKQMLMNLLSNAVKFTGKSGTVTVGCEFRNGTILLGVADTGLGMRREDAEIVMQPFRQVDGSHTRLHEGTGLGLPLVKSLIELHGGKILIDSAPRRGTTVTLTFPPERTVPLPMDKATQSIA